MRTAAGGQPMLRRVRPPCRRVGLSLISGLIFKVKESKLGSGRDMGWSRVQPGAAKMRGPTMAETDQTSSPIDTGVQRIRELNERIIAAAKRSGEQAVKTYEEALANLAEAVETSGDRSADWIQQFTRAQSAFIRSLAERFPDALERILTETRDFAERARARVREVSGTGPTSPDQDQAPLDRP